MSPICSEQISDARKPAASVAISSVRPRRGRAAWISRATSAGESK